MIGVQGWIASVLGLFVLSLVLAALVALAVRQRHGWHAKPKLQRFFEITVLLFVTGLVILAGDRAFSQYQNHRALRSIPSEMVRSIRVDKIVVTDRFQIAEIVRSLNNEEWFSSSHGGWAQDVSLVVTLNNGEVSAYRVAIYLKEEGAVIMFTPDGSGYAFSRSLPSALDRAGITLPSK